MAAGLATLNEISKPGFFEHLSPLTRQLTDGFNAIGKELNIPFCAQSVGGMFGIYFTEKIPENYSDVMNSDRESFNAFFHEMLEQGVYLAPSAFEAGFVSFMHSERVLSNTVLTTMQFLKNHNYGY